jgi:hypothetical protein
VPVPDTVVEVKVDVVGGIEVVLLVSVVVVRVRVSVVVLTVEVVVSV